MTPQSTPSPRYLDDDDPLRRVSHLSPRDLLLEALATQTPITTLCGIYAVPRCLRPPVPSCPMCEQIVAEMGATRCEG